MTVQVNTNIRNEQVVALLNHSIEREINFLFVGLRRTEERIRHFQTLYGAKSPDEAKNLSPLDRVEWEGEELTQEKLQEKIDILKRQKTTF